MRGERMTGNGGETGVTLITLERPPEGVAVEIGEMVSISAVQASNIVRDIREMVTNALGGRMHRYERLLELAKENALTQFRAALAAEGYDGALGVRFAHPHIVDGAAVVILYGTGFRYR